MKKKLLSALSALLVVGMLSGCGSGDTTVLKDMDVDKYVTLGEYKGLQADVAPVTVNEEDVDAWVDNQYFYALSAEMGGVTDRAVELGDTVSIDYEGKENGVAFSGGTAQGQSLTIGSGQFIDGFEEGLIGVMPGETVDLNLTFPESYSSADLAGKDVVFTVTVNFIVPEEKEDAIVALMGINEVYTVEALYDFAESYLNSYAAQDYSANMENAIIDAFMKNCTFIELPESWVQQQEDSIRESITTAAANNGVDVDVFTNYYYNADFEPFVVDYAEEAARQYIAFQAVANKENLSVSDEELDATLLEYAQSAGLNTIEEYIGDNPKEEYRDYIMYEKVLNFLIENAEVSE